METIELVGPAIFIEGTPEPEEIFNTESVGPFIFMDGAPEEGQSNPEYTYLGPLSFIEGYPIPGLPGESIFVPAYIEGEGLRSTAALYVVASLAIAERFD